MSEMLSPWSAAVAGVVLGIGALTGATLWGLSGGALMWLDVAVAVASLVAALAQLWWPVPGALAATLLAAVSPTGTPAATMGALQVAQRGRFPLAAGVAVAGAAAHLVQGLWRPSSGISLGWWLLLICSSYGALLGWGTLARSHRALLASLRERAHRAEAEQGRKVAEARTAERRKLAREMHDVLAHRLSLVATHAGALEYRPDSSPERLSRAAGVVRSGVHQALEELRQVIGLLREEDDSSDDLPGGLSDRREPWPTLADLPRLVDEARQAGQSVYLSDETAGDVPPAVGRTGYRVVQEGLTNARKHAPGRPVEVSLDGSPGTRLTITVTNPLPSPDAPPAPPGGGVGLVGLTERVRLAGGRLDHHESDGRFLLRAWLPWPA
ncbi:histidine kinase [Streptosporangium sp. NPDC020072]|uniref:sensor histidine kinase n=1 Tax=Streptosporangium sp. NPDC020072 TaxID=3154788 RepID=UPI00341E49A4